MADEVIVLREFRDQYLLTNAFGKMLVHAYYRYSPSLADFIAGHEPLRIITRIGLMPMVLAIKYPGVVVLALGLFGLAGVRRKGRHPGKP
jgi:hypothetical protein